MITYSKALELKNAGFPPPEYKKDKTSWILEETNGFCYHGVFMSNEEHIIRLHPGFMYSPSSFIYAPSLLELIEACGNRFTGLYKQQPGFSGYWQAVCNMMPGIMMEGSTPEEAVANLWLELNKK